jgi:hypothetical protein
MGLNEMGYKGMTGLNLGQGQVAGSFEHDDELSGSIHVKIGEFLGHLSDGYFSRRALLHGVSYSFGYFEKETYVQADNWTSRGLAA